MKFIIALVAAATSLVAAQNNPLNDIPKCAQDCVGKFLSGSSIAGCSLLDYKCVCSNKEFLNEIACCLAPVCDDKGKSDTIALANKLCKAFDVDLPTAVTCNTAATATPTSTGSSGSASATSSSDAGKTTSAASSGNQSAAASSTSKPNAAPTNMAGLVGAAAALAFAL
ncbi:hypothetical protein V2A60_008224 [Cordyceps javanica]